MFLSQITLQMNGVLSILIFMPLLRFTVVLRVVHALSLDKMLKNFEIWDHAQVLVVCILCSVIWCPDTDLRKEIREKYNIQGNQWRDCCVHCCSCCHAYSGLVQETREQELRGYGPCLENKSHVVSMPAQPNQEMGVMKIN